MINLRPGQPVTMAGNVSGRIMGRHSFYGSGVRYSVDLDRAGFRDVSHLTIQAAEPVPLREIGDRVRVQFLGHGTVTDWELRSDGTRLYTVTLDVPNRLTGETRRTHVGIERMIL